MFLPKDIVEILDEYFVGQAELKRALGAAAFIHGNPNRQYSPNVLVCGPSGTGKTAISFQMALEMGGPKLFVPITSYSQTGYVGDSISDILPQLATEAAQCAKRALERAVERRKEHMKFPKESTLKTIAPLANLVFDVEYRSRLNYTCKAILERKAVELPSEMPFNGFFYAKQEEEFNQLSETAKTLFVSDAKKLGISPGLYAWLQVLVYPSLAMRAMHENGVQSLVNFIELGVIVIDEIDKITTSESNDNVGRVGVQRDLLSLMNNSNVNVSVDKDILSFIDRMYSAEMDALLGAGWDAKTKGKSKYKYAVQPLRSSSAFDLSAIFSSGKSKKGKDVVSVDTAKIMFIGCGAFSIDQLDGLIDELRGRFSIVTRTKEYSKTDLLDMLACKYLNEFNEQLTHANIKLTMAESVAEIMADMAYELNKLEPLGARRVPNMLNTLLLQVADMFEEGATINITEDMLVALDADIRKANKYATTMGFS